MSITTIYLGKPIVRTKEVSKVEKPKRPQRRAKAEPK